MANFTAAQVGMYYPKGRDVIYKVMKINRTDSSTPKMTLPKDAVICDVRVFQDAVAVTAAGAYNLGWSGATTAILNAFSLPTTSVGHVTSGTATGTGFMSKLTQDRSLIGTYTVGSSTAGGTGYVIIGYFMPGGQEGVDD
jgi:hypothetical protein